MAPVDLLNIGLDTTDHQLIKNAVSVKYNKAKLKMRYPYICLLMFNVHAFSFPSLLFFLPSKISASSALTFTFSETSSLPLPAKANPSYSTQIILSTLFCNLCLYIPPPIRLLSP